MSNGKTRQSGNDGVVSQTLRSAAAEAGAERVTMATVFQEVMPGTQSEQEQDELRRSSGREIAAAILEGQPLPEIASLITDIVAQRLQVERVGLYLRDAQGLLRPIALRNISAEYGRGITRLVLGSPTANRAQATGLPVFARDVQQHPQISPELRDLYCRENITSLLLVMLHYEQRLAGTLAVYPDPDRTFTPYELSVFHSLADMASLGIALSQQLQQQREIAMLEERNRLGREIHDTVAQSLVTLILQIEMTQISVRGGDSAAAGEMLTQARILAKNALEDTRRAVRGLAAATQTLSSSQSIAQEAKQLEAESGIPTQFILTGEEQMLTPDQRTTLLRIVQEALTNARKHARPQRIRVGLQFGAEEVMLLVEDDGAGFDAKAIRAPGLEGGYGLFGMNERAQLVGATLQIDSTPGWGTRIRLALPYRPSSPVTGGKIQDSGLREQKEQKANREEEKKFASTLNRASTGSPEGQQPSTASSQPLIRVLIVDDHALARQGIRAMLRISPEVDVVGEAADGEQAVMEAERLHPDVILMDLQMPGVDGLQGLRRLHIQQPDTPVVMLTTFQTEQMVSDVLAAGARGFLLKDTDPAELLAAVRAARRGESLLAPAITDRLASLASGQGREAREASELNEREREVLQLLAQGARNKQIAAALFIAPKTVEYHLSNIFSKLGVSNRTEAARAALEQGLVPPVSQSLK